MLKIPPNAIHDVPSEIKLTGDVTVIKIILAQTEDGSPFIALEGLKTDGASEVPLKQWQCRVLALNAIALLTQHEGMSSEPKNELRLARA